VTVAVTSPEAVPMLETRALEAGYVDNVPILRGVDITVAASEIVSIVGPNGAGKSTLMKTVFGLLAPRDGNVLLQGCDIAGDAPHKIARQGVSYVAQRENVFPSMTVHENLELGALARPQVNLHEQLDLVFDLFPRLKQRRRQTAGTMSGGERQMVAIGRALIPAPHLLLLDEPSAGLSPAYVDIIFDRIAQINRGGVTVVMVEQNATRALAMSDRGYVLELGRKRFEGPGPELVSDPKVAELYLGGAGTARPPQRSRRDDE